MGLRRCIAILVAICLLISPAPGTEGSPQGISALNVAVVQMRQEATLAENREKIIRLTGTAATKGSRLVVFPEAALAAPAGTPMKDVQAALADVGHSAKANGVYVVVVATYLVEGKSRFHNQLHLFSPQGETLLVYDKDGFAKKAGDPRLVNIDGVPCSFIICSDRWSRPVESLPPMLGAKVIIECSANWDTEWIPSLEWYWYVPRALRNSAYVIFANTARDSRFPDGVRGHGHSAVIAPDGTLVAAAGDEPDTIVTADLDISKATREMALRRSQHPLFKDWWDLGKAIHAGREFPIIETPPLVSSKESVKCGFAHMSCSSSIQPNVDTIKRLCAQAASDGLDLVVFPELAVTGDRASDVMNSKPNELENAVEAIRQTARAHHLAVVFGAASYVGTERRNSAYAIGKDGSILTRYDQIAVSRTDLFQSGRSTKSMWFQVNGVWSFLTIGDDDLWNEMAELAALRGARLHCHLSHELNRNPREALRQDQIQAAFASYRTLTVVANPLFPAIRNDAQASFGFASSIWDDLEAGHWCAVKTHVGRPWEKVYSFPRVVPGAENPIRQIGYWRKGSPQYRSWMMVGAEAMYRDGP